MHTTPVNLITEKTPQISVEAATLLLEQALAAEKKETEEEAELAHKRAVNAYTGASILVPREVPVTPEQESGS